VRPSSVPASAAVKAAEAALGKAAAGSSNAP
jgi:hypothetical protein